MIPRYLTSMSSSAGITFGLLLLMQLLIATGNAPPVDKTRVTTPPVLIDPPEDTPVVTTEEVEPPPPVEPQPATMPNPGQTEPGIFGVGPTMSAGPVTTGTTVGPPEGHAMLLVAVQPTYPLKLLRRGIEGYVVVEFMVTAEGTVTNVLVLESSHRGFEVNAIQAAERMKFKPRILNGTPIPVQGVRKLFRFEIES